MGGDSSGVAILGFPESGLTCLLFVAPDLIPAESGRDFLTGAAIAVLGREFAILIYRLGILAD